jgi:uncharacterized protein (TIGR03083 family)
VDDAAFRDALALEAADVSNVDRADLDRPVPWLDGWRVADVVGHLSGVQRWATALVTSPDVRIRRRDMASPPEDDAVLEWYADGVAPMLAALSRSDLDQTVHTWAGERPARWWLRRLTHETAMHRWDARATAEGAHRARPIDALLAADGIDELFENFLPLVHDAFGGAGQTLHVHAADVPGEWQLTFLADTVRVERTHAKGDVAVRGRAADLLLVLWNRVDLDHTEVEVFGDASVLDLWARTARF